ncbi:MAG: GNAT family N-acetyltransferase [Dehalococcoidia bacterium]
MFVLDPGDGLLAGSAFASWENREQDAGIFQVWLDEDLRGQGWAEALMDAAEAFSADLGAPACALWVADGNGRARRFYERCGYMPSGITQPFRDGEELLLRKVLPRPS